ncbi:MAG: MFS transporter [Gammaproteobacteria bacterium]
MALVQEIVLLAIIGPFGALADRIGRRKVGMMGYLITAIAYLLYPFATSVEMLTVCRVIFAVGVAGVVSTFTVVLTDYPQERSRSKMVATCSILNGLGIAILGPLCAQLPYVFTNAGYDAATAGQLSLGLVAALALFTGIIFTSGIVAYRPGVPHQKQPLMHLIRDGLVAARNPRIALAYFSAFAARGDVVVVGTYLSLWYTQAGATVGLSTADAVSEAGKLFGIAAGIGLLAGPVFIAIGDRINRVSGLILGMGIAAAGYISFGLLPSPLASGAIFAAILLGLGQTSSIIVGQTLIGQESDPRITGAVLGVFNFFGAFGTLIGAVVGGFLFDLWRPGGPFLLMGAANLTIVLAAVYVRARFPGDKLVTG